jgi:hypothetical protein
MIDNALLTEMIARQKRETLELGFRHAEAIEAARAGAPRTGVRTAIASLLARIAMRIDAAASDRAFSAQR